jgi:hypothetical protein
MDLREVLNTHFKDQGVDVNLRDEDIPMDMVVLIRVQRLKDSADALVVAATDNLGGIVQYGIVQSAVLHLQSWMLGGEED